MALLWLDLETTGLSAREDYILEVAWTVTDENLLDLLPLGDGEVRTMLVDCGGAELGRLAAAPDVVKEMHERSGLIADLTDIMALHYSLEEIGEDIGNDIARYVEASEPVYLAGASVHFDLGFLREHLPEVAARASHRVYDTSTLKAFFESIGVEHGIVNENQHRAKDDVIETLAVARRYREWVQTVQAMAMEATV